MSYTVTVSLTLNIYDEIDFRKAAFAAALKDGEPAQAAREFLNDHKKSLGECGAMLLDPGQSPAGADIVGCDWDWTGAL